MVRISSPGEEGFISDVVVRVENPLLKKIHTIREEKFLKLDMKKSSLITHDIKLQENVKKAEIAADISHIVESALKSHKVSAENAQKFADQLLQHEYKIWKKSVIFDVEKGTFVPKGGKYVPLGHVQATHKTQMPKEGSVIHIRGIQFRVVNVEKDDHSNIKFKIEEMGKGFKEEFEINCNENNMNETFIQEITAHVFDELTKSINTDPSLKLALLKKAIQPVEIIIKTGQHIADLLRSGKNVEAASLIEKSGLSEYAKEIEKGAIDLREKAVVGISLHIMESAKISIEVGHTAMEIVEASAVHIAESSEALGIAEAHSQVVEVSTHVAEASMTALHALAVTGAVVGMATSTLSTIVTSVRMVKAITDKGEMESLIRDVRNEILRSQQSNEIEKDKADVLLHFFEYELRDIQKNLEKLSGEQVSNAISMATAIAAVVVAAGVAGPAAPIVILTAIGIGIAIFAARKIKEARDKAIEIKRQERFETLMQHSLSKRGNQIAMIEALEGELIPKTTLSGHFSLDPAEGNFPTPISDALTALGVENLRVYAEVRKFLTDHYLKVYLNEESYKAFSSHVSQVKISNNLLKIMHLLEGIQKTVSPKIREHFCKIYNARLQSAYTDTQNLHKVLDADLLNGLAQKNDVLNAAIEASKIPGFEPTVEWLQGFLTIDEAKLKRMEVVQQRLSEIMNVLATSEDFQAHIDEYKHELSVAQSSLEESLKAKDLAARINPVATKRIDFLKKLGPFKVAFDDAFWEKSLTAERLKKIKYDYKSKT